MLAFVSSLIWTVPWLQDSFSPTTDPLDASWQWILGYGIQHHMQWGKSLIFTYGPLGFLAAHPYFFSYHALWALCAMTAILTWVGFGLIYFSASLAISGDHPSYARKLVIIVFAWLIGGSLIDISMQSAFIAILLLAYALQRRDSGRAAILTALSGALFAFGSLIKSTSLIITLFVLLIYPLLWLYVHRSRKAVSAFLGILSFLIFAMLFYVGSGQHIANLTRYVVGAFEIANGYTSAMSTHGENLQTLAALFILLLFAVTTLRLIAQGNRLVVAQLVLFGVMLFMAWKEGLTRHDPGFGPGHAMVFYGTALLVAGVMIPILDNGARNDGATSIAGAYLAALIFALPGTSLFAVDEIANYHTFYNLMTNKRARAVFQHSQNTAIRNQFHLHRAALEAVRGSSVNIVPWDLMMAQGYHMELLPSPIFQAYSAYTPYLDHVNADQIWKTMGAQKIIYSFQSIDGRYPVFDEPATFRAMLTCYHTVYSGLRYSVLDRNECARPRLLRIGATKTPRFGAWVKIPSHVSYVDIDIHTSLFGRVADIIYKPRQMYITFRLADGSVRGPYRFIYPVGGDGLFVKYFIHDQAEAGRLFAGDATGLKRISAIRLTTSKESWEYGTQFMITVFQTNRHRIWKTGEWSDVALTLPSPLVPYVEHNTQYRRAWGELSDIYFARPDLQKAFPENGRQFYVALLRWATFTTPSSDDAYQALHPFQRTYRSMLGMIRMSASTLTPPILLVTLVDHDGHDKKAWDKLSKIYFSRPDLQKAFPLNNLASYAGFLRWASVGIPSSDPAFLQLQPFRAAYKAMLVHVN